MRANNYIGVTKQADLEEPTVDDVFDVGTIANIIQLLKLPDGTVKVFGGRATTRENQSIK